MNFSDLAPSHKQELLLDLMSDQFQAISVNGHISNYEKWGKDCVEIFVTKHSIGDFFGVDRLSQITEEMLAAAKTDEAPASSNLV